MDDYHTNLLRKFDPKSINACFVGVGSFGSDIQARLHDLKAFYQPTVNQIWEPFKGILYAGDLSVVDTIDDSLDLVFLAGSSGDDHFWLTREYILARRPYFLISLIQGNNPAGSPSEKSCSPHDKEAQIFFEEVTAVDYGLGVIQEFYSSLAVPPLIGMGLGDIVKAIGKGKGKCIVVEGALAKIVEKFAVIVEDNKEVINGAGGVLLIVAYSHELKWSLDHLLQFAEIISKSASSYDYLCWTATGFQNIEKGVRVTLIISNTK